MQAAIAFIIKYWKPITSVLAIVVSFAFGHFTGPTKIVTNTVTVQVEHKQEDVKTDTHQVQVKKPDGTTTTTTDTKTDDSTNTNIQDSTKTTNDIVKQPNTNISVLAGLDTKGANLVYGLSVTRTLLGPITAGIWANTSRTVGLSLGISF
jgi:hypothetical protein